MGSRGRGTLPTPGEGLKLRSRLNSAPQRTQSRSSMLRLAPRARSRATGLAGAACLVIACAAGCAGPGRDVHLAPLYSNLSTAGGGREVEALAGVMRVRYPT